MENIKVGEYGLENSTEGMYARTINGILGMIVNANSDELISGPEIEVNEKIYCVERDSIKDIKENILDLIKEGDILKYKLKGLNNEYITVVKKYYDSRSNAEWLIINGYKLEQVEILEILTKEQYNQNYYRVEE